MSRKRKERSGAKRNKKIVTPYKQKNDKPNLAHRFFVFTVGLILRLILQVIIKPLIPEPLLSMVEALIEQFIAKL